MSTELLKRAKELCEKATPGPWFVDVCISGNTCWCRTIGTEPGNDSLEKCIIPSGTVGKDNAEFIAESRTLIPELISLVEKLKVQNEKLVKASRYSKEFLIVGMPTFSNEYVKQDARESLDKLIVALTSNDAFLKGLEK